MKCHECEHWVPIGELTGFCYKRPLKKTENGQPVFGKTKASNPCNNFLKRFSITDRQWTHIYEVRA